MKSSEKATPIVQLKKDVRNGTLGVKKQSLPYTNSNIIMQTKIYNEEPKTTTETEMSGTISNKAKTSGTTIAKQLGVTRNGSQSRQPSHKTVCTGSLHVNVG